MARIILVDSDGMFLSNLEWYFVKQSKGEIEIETISNRDYLSEFFSQPRSADALVISQTMYFPDLEKHNIGRLFVLTEDDELGDMDRSGASFIPKYEVSLPEMYNTITGILKQGGTAARSTETSVVLVYSPIGGSGATSIAAGICACLEKNYKNTLFLDAGNLQTFGSFFSDDYQLECWQKEMFERGRSDTMDSLRVMIRREVCDYLPPYSVPLYTIPVTGQDYADLITSVRQSKEYEYVVVTCGSEFSEDVSRLLSASDRVVLVYEQGYGAGAKLDALLRNINFSDSGKFTFVCNRYSDDRPLCEGVLAESEEMCRIVKLPYMIRFPEKISAFSGIAGFQAIVDAIQ